MSAPRQATLSFIFITLLIDVIGLGIIIPVLPALLQELTHSSLSDAAIIGGWLLIAYSGMEFLCAPIMGGLSDQYGRRPILLLSLFGFGIDYLILAIAPNIGWLFVGRIIAGILGASYSTATAYIADISTEENRAKNFGMVGAAFGMGFIIGPVIGGLLGKYGTHVPFIGASVLSFLNCLYGLFILPESLKPENRRKFDWKRTNPLGSLKQLGTHPLMIGLALSFFLINIAGHSLQSTWTYFVEERFHWDTDEVGYSLGFVGVLIAIVQGGLTDISVKKLGLKKAVYIGCFLSTAGIGLFALANQSWMMYAIMIPYALGGIAMPALQSIMAGNVGADEQGELQGALTSIISITSIIGPFIMTYLFAFFTGDKAPVYFPGSPFIMAAVLLLASTVITIRTLRKYHS